MISKTCPSIFHPPLSVRAPSAMTNQMVDIHNQIYNLILVSIIYFCRMHYSNMDTKIEWTQRPLLRYTVVPYRATPFLNSGKTFDKPDFLRFVRKVLCFVDNIRRQQARLPKPGFKIPSERVTDVRSGGLCLNVESYEKHLTLIHVLLKWISVRKGTSVR